MLHPSENFLATCICAVFLSPVAKEDVMNHVVAITIPKRCKIVNRHIGQKCGNKFLSSCIFISFTHIHILTVYLCWWLSFLEGLYLPTHHGNKPILIQNNNASLAYHLSFGIHVTNIIPLRMIQLSLSSFKPVG